MPTRIGDDFTLPSGRVIRVNCGAEPRRLWYAVGRKSDARVCRAHLDPSAPGVEFYSELGSDLALIFDECDAKVFAGILNTVRRFGFRRATDRGDRRVSAARGAGIPARFSGNC
jgi:hypothetical protein